MNRSILVAAMIGVSALGFAAVAIGGVAGQDTVTVDVTLVDQNGEGVGSAELTATWDGGSTSATTTSGGAALLEVEAGADIEITVDHPVYVRNQPFEINNARIPEGNNRLPVEIDVSKSATTAITVTDESGEPVANAAVRFRQQFENRSRVIVETVRTDEDGMVETGEIERGEYTVLTRAERFLDTEQDVRVDDPNNVLNLTISRGFVELTVNVTDDHYDTLQAVENANIEIEDDIISTRSDGTRSTDVAVNTRYEVSVTKDGYESATETITVQESTTRLNVSISRSPEINIESVQDRIVVDEQTTVTVTDEYGDPVEDARIALKGDQVGRTDSNGEFGVQILTDGEQTISASRGTLSDSLTVEGISPGSDETPTPTETPTATPTETPEDDDSLGPGFGIGTVVVALMAAALLARRR